MLNLNFKSMVLSCLLAAVFASTYLLTEISGNFLIPLLVFFIFFLIAAKWFDFSIPLLVFFTILSPALTDSFLAENVLWAEFALLGISSVLVLKSNGIPQFLNGRLWNPIGCKKPPNEFGGIMWFFTKFFSKNSSGPKFNFLDFLALGFFLISLISFGLQFFENKTIEPYSIRLAVLIFEFLLLYFIGKNLGNSIESVKKTINAMIVSAIILSIFGIMLFNLPNSGIQSILGFQETSNFSRLSFPFFYENSAGLFFAVFLACSFCLALFSNGKKRKLYFAGCIPIFFALLYTYSRWSWLIALGSVIIALSLKINLNSTPNSSRKIVLKIFLCIALALLVFMAGFIAINQLNYNSLQKNSSQSFFTRLSISDNSFEGRLQIWNTVINGIMQNPLFGNGLGSFQNTYFGLFGRDFDATYNARNTFLQIAIEQGLIAAIMLFAFQLFLLNVLFKKIKSTENEKPLIIALFLIVFAFFAGGFFEFAFYSTRNAMLFWLIAGISTSLIGKKIQQNQNFSNQSFSIKAISWILIILVFFLFAWLPFASIQMEKAAIGLKVPIEKQIKNPSFEKGFLGWKECGSFEIIPTTEESKTGKYSMKIENQAQTEKWSCLSTILGYVVELEPNTIYKFSAFFFVPENSSITGQFKFAPLILPQPKCENQKSGNNCYSILEADNFIDNSSAKDEWFEKYFLFKTGNGKAYLMPRIETTNELNGSGTFYVDDFKMEKISETSGKNRE